MYRIPSVLLMSDLLLTTFPPFLDILAGSHIKVTWQLW